VGQAKWGPDGSLIAVGCEDGVRIFDSNLELLNFVAIDVPNDMPNSFPLSWSPDGSYLAAVTTLLDQNWIQIWNTSDFSSSATIPLEPFNPFPLFVWSPDSTQIALSDMSDLQIWDVSASPQLTTTLTGHTDIIVDISWNSLQTNLIATIANDKTLNIWNSTTELLENSYGLQSFPQTIAWNPQASQIALSKDSQIEIRDIPSWNLSNNLVGHGDDVIDLTWSGNGLASTSYDKTAVIWDIVGGQPAETLQGHTDAVMTIDWQPTGNNIVTSGDSTIRTWNTSTGDQEDIFSSFNTVIYSMSWKHSDSQIVSGSSDNRVQIWDASTGNFLMKLGMTKKALRLLHGVLIIC
jgi:WD40 repeat protein